MYEQKKVEHHIRGVNIGGWLVLENFITPFYYMITECDLKGDFRFYPGQIDAPPESSPLWKHVKFSECPLVPRDKIPHDEWEMMKLFRDANNGSTTIAEQYLDFHFDNMVKREDVTALKEGGITHVRVPLGFWILGDIADDEPYVAGGWKYFQRFAEWCREDGIQIWPDLHGAPGSQNGFDNSGHIHYVDGHPSCLGWDGNTTDAQMAPDDAVLPPNVQRTLKIVDNITAQIVADGMGDVVTGFGLLNEPFGTCNHIALRKYYNSALDIARKNMGNDTAIYISDQFAAWNWIGGFWSGEAYENTYLDSHFYQNFDPNARHATPRQHIALVCGRDHRAATSCCHDKHMKPYSGMGRISTEFTGMPDKDVSIQIPLQVDHIYNEGWAFEFDRKLNNSRVEFIKKYNEAQMVNFEDAGFSAWFYWNFKVEGGYCAEWDFLRGMREGFVPEFPAPDVSMSEEYGDCYDILFKTADDVSVIEEFPDTPSFVTGWYDDDTVNAHGDNMRKIFGKWYMKGHTSERQDKMIVPIFICIGFLMYLFMGRKRQNTYTKIPDSPESTSHFLGISSGESEASDGSV